MKEVRAHRYAGPFAEFPKEHLGDYYYCNPIGLVPKGEIKDLSPGQLHGIIDPSQCRLIFHLSYEFPQVGSVNGSTDQDACRVEYQGIDQAVQKLMTFDSPFMSKTDGVSAFSHLPVRKEDWNLMVMRARCPKDGQTYYFISKVIGFGHSISCRLFSEFMEAVTYVAGTRCTQGQPIYYLDDVICIDGSELGANHQLITYMQVCEEINYPLSEEKTIWATQIIVFLGMLIDAVRRILAVPVLKRDKAMMQIRQVLTSKKIKMHQLQKLTGLLNFLCRAVVPGRAFTRRLYYRTVGLKQHHHLRVDEILRADLQLWESFLTTDHSLFRPFMDFSIILQAEEISLSSDASKLHAWGCTYKNHWSFGEWNSKDKERLQLRQLNIQIQEMLAFAVAVELFAPLLTNRRIVAKCDNQAVVHMINNSSSNCRVCMEMIRLITLTSMKYNCRIFARWIPTKENGLADAISRLDFVRFFKLDPDMDKFPIRPPANLWPMKDEWWDL